MKPLPPKYKRRHTQAEKDYFKNIADQVRAAREAATSTTPAQPESKQGEYHHGKNN